MKKGWKRGVLITKGNNGDKDLCAVVIEYEDKIQEICKKVEADYVEMPIRYLGGKPYRIVCDEEGLLNPQKRFKATAFSSDLNEMLVGILLIVGLEDANGEITNIPLREAQHIVESDQFYYRLQIGNKVKRIALRYTFRP